MTVPHQGFLRHAFCQIDIAGKDVTDAFEPHLLSVTVIDTLEGLEDRCSIELDDRDASLAIPRDDDPVSVFLGWEPRGPRVPPVPQDAVAAGAGELKWEGGMFMVFNGFVTSVESGFARRGGGRRLWVDATGHQTKSTVKEARHDSMGVGVGGSPITLQQWLSYVGAKVGMTVKIDPKLAQKQRDFWYQGNESFMSLGEKLASELGGKFKISGNIAIMVDALSGMDASGTPFGTIEAEWGKNLIAWRLKPFIGRPQWKESRSRYFARWHAQWKEFIGSIEGTTPFGDAEAITDLPSPAPNKGVGEQIATGLGADSVKSRGKGWAIINGDPHALAGRWMLITGARPGVDGVWTISEAEHMYTRNGGYTTRCNLEQPKLSDAGYVLWEQTAAGRSAAGQTQLPPMSRELSAADVRSEANLRLEDLMRQGMTEEAAKEQILSERIVALENDGLSYADAETRARDELGWYTEIDQELARRELERLGATPPE